VTIRYEKNDEHIVLITIDRPEKRNALDLYHWRDLVEAWKTYRDDPDAWVAIITGVENSFCSGADLVDMMPKAIAKFRELPPGANFLDVEVDGISLSISLQGVMRNLSVYKPIIAAVNGFCTAGGMELLIGTDLVIAAESASFGVTEPRQGLFSGGGTTPRLVRQLGWKPAMEILLVAERITPQRALEIGLINKIVPYEELLEEAYIWARKIAANAPLAVQATKESSLRCLAAGSLEEAYAIEQEVGSALSLTNDAVEGPRAFAEKRPPVWTGT
jgi:enoyl-CoA hydratase